MHREPQAVHPVQTWRRRTLSASLLPHATVLALLVLVPVPALAGEGNESEAPPPGATATEDEAPLSFQDLSGYLQGRYRARATSDDDDQDAYLSILLNGGDPQRHKLTFSVMGSFSSDIDGRDSPSDFDSIEDTYSSRAHGRLLRAYLDVNRIGFLERVRGGRQDLVAIPEVSLFDGLLAETLPTTGWKAKFRAFAGVPTHLYESSPSGDSLFGAGVEAEPTEELWAALHVARIRDELLYSTEANELVALEARQRLTEVLSVSGRMTAVEGNTRDLTARLSYADALNSWRGSLQYFALLRTQRTLVTGLDPYTAVMKEERPHQTVNLLLEKDIDSMWTLGGGLSMRELTDDDEESTFNHEWRRLFVTPSLRGWPDQATDLSVTGELWEAEDQLYRTAGFAVGRDFSKDLRAELGSEYALFKFNEALGEEHEQVRTGYLRTRYDLRKDLRVDLDLELERDDQDTYRTLTLGLRWRF
ncbi:MAG: hypothetical protein AB1486_12915 [Planctomycetota bacterium]